MTLGNVEYEVVKVRSIFAPRWWEVRRRFFWWRPATRRAEGPEEDGPAVWLAEMDRLHAEVERRMLFGDLDA